MDQIPPLARLGSLYATWLTVGVALVGQLVWVSWQYGRLAEDVGHAATVDQVSTVTSKLADLERRVVSIETNGSPNVIALKTAVDVDTRRIDTIEHIVPDQVERLAVSNSAQEERLAGLRRDLDALKAQIDAH